MNIPDEQYIQSPPFCLQVEMTEGCNLRCQFCGLNGIRGKESNYKFLTTGLAANIVDLLNKDMWIPRIEFAMHGEPSLNPDMVEILRVFREGLPKRAPLMMTSNGAGFVKSPTETIDKCMEYLNVLALDWYEGIQLVPRILDQYRGVHRPIFYPADRSGNPHRRRRPGCHDLVVVQDIVQADRGTHASLNNHAGAGAPKNNNAQGKRCAKPFREMSIRWDGSVAVCCNDWRGEYKCGSVVDMTLEEIWQSPAMRAARKKLYHGMRDFGPCAGCDALSYRPGLLPDLQGKKSLPRPNLADQKAISVALAGGTFTLPVLRPWEL